MNDAQPFPRTLIWLVITVSVFIYGILSLVWAPVSLEGAGIPTVVLILLAAGACGVAVLVLKASPPGLAPHVRDLLVWASLESVALIGMLAAWTSGRGVLFLPFGLVALGLLMVARPRG